VTERRISHGSSGYLEATIDPPYAPNEGLAFEEREFLSLHQIRPLWVVESLYSLVAGTWYVSPPFSMLFMKL